MPKTSIEWPFLDQLSAKNPTRVHAAPGKGFEKPETKHIFNDVALRQLICVTCVFMAENGNTRGQACSHCWLEERKDLNLDAT